MPRWLVAACCLVLWWPAAAQTVLTPGDNPLEEPDFLPVDEAFVLTARVTDDGVLVADWRMPEGYYLYRHRFGFETRDGTVLGAPETPAGLEKTDEFFGEVEVFYGTATVRVPVVAAGANPFEVAIDYQGCADYGLCYPPERKWLRFAAAGVDMDVAAGGLALAELLAILASAVVGGLILNLMPCVFPVLSIKALSLLGAPEGRLRDAAGFSAGVVATFVLLGLALVALKGAGEAVGWGFQLQSPGFVAAIALLFFVLGLNLLGVLETPGFGVGGLERAGPFAAGMLAVVVATPCTVPFMGAAVGYGLSQPAPVLLAVMVALGVGMALPYVVVVGVPAVAARLPRPGPWMATLKQVMAFPMFATVVWLVWVLALQSGAGGAAWVLGAFVVAGFLAWLGMRRAAWLRPVWVAVAGLTAFSVWAVSSVERPAMVVEGGFDMQVVEAHRAEGRPVFLNFTAAWCITCLTNEQSTLGTDRVRSYFKERGIAYVKGDWTNADPAITAVLERFGRSGVPLYVYFPPEGDPVVLPQILTPGVVIGAIDGTS